MPEIPPNHAAALGTPKQLHMHFPKLSTQSSGVHREEGGNKMNGNRSYWDCSASRPPTTALEQ